MMKVEAKILYTLTILGLVGFVYGISKPNAKVMLTPPKCEEVKPFEPKQVVPKLITIHERPRYIVQLATAMTMYRRNPIKYDEAVEYVQAMVHASAVHGVPVETLIAIAWVETRWKPLLTGDNGKSCGMYQQQTKYSRGALGERSYVRSRKASEECLLLKDYRYASHVAAGLIKNLKAICQYNHGPKCAKSEGYTAKVESVQRHFRKVIRDSID